MNLLAQSLKDNLVCTDTSDSDKSESVPREIMATSDAAKREPFDLNSFDAPGFKVFANPMLFEKIAQHLDFTALKALSGTGKLLQEMTRSSSLFTKKTHLNLLNGNLATRNLDVLQGEIVPWNSVKLQVGNWSTKDYETIQDVLSMPTVETLELEQEVTEREFYSIHSMQIPQTPEQVSFNQSVTRLMTSPQNLGSLKLNVELLSRVENIFDSPEVHQCLESLHTLEISVPNILAQSRVSKDFLDRDGDRYRIFTNNLSCLARLSNMNLRSFTFQMNIEHRGIAIPYLAALLQILVHNQNTLEQLSLHGHIWSCSELAQVQCPLLKSLDVNTQTKSCNSSTVAAFIEQQPLLRSLSLQITGEIVGFRNKNELFNVIQQRSSKLERLHISWTLTTDSNAFDWTFLRNMRHLKDFSVNQQQRVWGLDERSTVVQLLNHLPPSLEQLQIYAHARPRATRPRIDGLEAILMSSLANLTNLKVLDLMYGVPDTISDAGLQFICSHMKQLEVLRLNRCDTLTDFGISGKRDGQDTGISLANLKRLQKLEIRKCENVNFSTLMSVLAFKELKELHLWVPINWDDVQATSQQIVKMATQNPRLERLKIGKCHATKSKQFSKEGLKTSIKNCLPTFKELQLYAGVHWPIGSTEAVFVEEL